MEVLLILVVGAVNILCFMVGAKVGQTVTKGEEVKLPKLNPVEAVQEYREKREAEKESSWLDTVLSNVENFNGSAEGQKDVPGR